MKSLKFLAAILLLPAFFACDNDEKDDNPTSADIVDYQFLDATSYSDWVYFSFEKGEIVTVTDFANDLSWDIAFHRGDLRLNGGASGIGQGAALNTRKKKWEDVVSAPQSGYAPDGIGLISVAFTGEGTILEEQPFSQTLAEWMTMTIDPNNPPPKYEYNEWVFVVKTADGKYVKLSIYDYKNAKNAGAYISFKYQFSQANGVF